MDTIKDTWTGMVCIGCALAHESGEYMHGDELTSDYADGMAAYPAGSTLTVGSTGAVFSADACIICETDCPGDRYRATVTSWA